MGLEPNPYLVASSLGFIVPISFNLVYHQFHLYSINVAIMLISSIYHVSKYPPLFYLDAFTGYFVAIINSYHSIQHGYSLIPIPSILYAVIMFWYGYKYNCFVWDPSLSRATLWHLSMHISSITTITTVALLTN